MRKFMLLLVVVFTLLLAACQEDASSQDNDASGDEGTDETSSQNESQTEDEETSLWDEIEAAGEITVATSGTLIAASYYDDNDELTGYDVEVVREVANRLGLEVNFEIMGIDGMLPAVDNGRVDLAANDIEATDSRKESFNFSDPYKYSHSVMVVRESDYSGIHALTDLEGKRAGGGATTIYSQIAEHFGATVVTYGNASNEAYLSDVSTGRTDVVVNDLYLSTFGVGAFPDFDIMIHPDLKFHPTEQAMVVKLGEDELTDKINEALQEMRDDGTLSELAERFYLQDASVPSDEEVEEIDGLDL